jgi:hypothetical protein
VEEGVVTTPSDRTSVRPTERRGFRRTLGVAIGALLISGFGSLYLIGAGQHPVTVDRALERFRGGSAPASPMVTPSPTSRPSSVPSVLPTKTTVSPHGATAASPSGPIDPAEGVYVYATDGYEVTDALSGARHDYPSRTTITISRHGCGFIWRWQPLDERWDESEACRRPSGVVLGRFSMYHEFFRQGIREDFQCGDDAVVWPSKPRIGDRWAFDCASNGSQIHMTVSVVARETRAVGGEAVRTFHVRYDVTMTGESQGRMVQDRWLDASTGLAIRIVTAVDATVATPVGRANYLERYTIDLISTRPQR